jgi:flagellar biosynthesis protein FlhF
MKIKRFFAENIRQAMQMVRDDLGADAVIMSNRAVEGGVEIVAARDFDEQVVHSSAPAKGAVEVSADYFKPPKNARNIKKVDLPDFQAEKNRLHVISSSRKPDEKVYKNASAKKGINQYVDNAQ